MKINFRKEKGGYYLDVPVLCGDLKTSDFITMKYDTAAFMTVVSKEVYYANHFNMIKSKKLSVKGYGSYGVSGIAYKIPCVKLGARLLKGVWTFTPHDENITDNILGCNVIEYYSPHQDNEDCVFYFYKNMKPAIYRDEYGASLACDKIIDLDTPEWQAALLNKYPNSYADLAHFDIMALSLLVQKE